MAHIEKRKQPNGKITYRARIRLVGMPDISASFSTRSKAKQWACKKEFELKESRYFPRDEGKNRTFDAFVNYYIEKVLSKNPRSFQKQRQLILWWKSKLGKYYLVHISPSMIAELRDQLLAETTRRGRIRSSSTTNRYLSALSKAFTICVKELGWLKENPVQFISKPSEAKARNRYLSPYEIERLLTACKLSRSRYLYTIVLFALTTGARRGEILNLKWTDLDLHANVAIFRHTKNGEQRGVMLSPLLKEHLMRQRGRRIVLSPYIFPNQDGKQPADIETAWDCVIKRADLPGLRFHDLRHTAASHLAMSGASTLEIAAILGHKTLAMVKRYSHLSTSATAKALKKMHDTLNI